MEPQPGSWRAQWFTLLGKDMADAPEMGEPERELVPLCPAPGSYVLRL